MVTLPGVTPSGSQQTREMGTRRDKTLLNTHVSHPTTDTLSAPRLCKLKQEKQAAQKRLEEEERAERQRFHDQV